MAKSEPWPTGPFARAARKPSRVRSAARCASSSPTTTPARASRSMAPPEVRLARPAKLPLPAAKPTPADLGPDSSWFSLTESCGPRQGPSSPTPPSSLPLPDRVLPCSQATTCSQANLQPSSSKLRRFLWHVRGWRKPRGGVPPPNGVARYGTDSVHRYPRALLSTPRTSGYRLSYKLVLE